MARITNAQKAGLDFLDQLFFNEMIVEICINAEEQRQLDSIISRVSKMVEINHSGRAAEIVKHVCYCFLELNLGDTREEWIKAFPIKEVLPKISKQDLEAMDHFRTVYAMGALLALTEKSTKINVDCALEIFEELKNEFRGCPALVRGHLVARCFAREFSRASLMSYCWMTTVGVLPVTKNGPERMAIPYKDVFLTRLTLMANYEMVTNHLKIMMRMPNVASVFFEKNAELSLPETTVDRLRNIRVAFDIFRSKRNLYSTIPLINNIDLKDHAAVKLFFEGWGARRERLRMHSGTLASWLGILGAGMVEATRLRELIKISRKNGAGSSVASNLRMPAIFNANHNEDTITNSVEIQLSECGLQITADSLYRTHNTFKRSTMRLLSSYCDMTRNGGVSLPTTHDDYIYLSIFIHAGKIDCKKQALPSSLLKVGDVNQIDWRV